MSFDFSTLLWIFIALTLLQPLLASRWYVMRRIQAIRAIEKLHGSRAITMIHRQEKHSLFGFAVSRHIDLEDVQTIIAAIMDTPDDMPIDFVIHTPGGLVLAAMQIARALEAHKAKVTVYVSNRATTNPGRDTSPLMAPRRKRLLRRKPRCIRRCANSSTQNRARRWHCDHAPSVDHWSRSQATHRSEIPPHRRRGV